jgi:hypothetical protein
MTDGDVVDPIRVPDWLRDRVRRAWTDTPLLARVFVGLAIVDVLVRWFGILQPAQSGFLDLRGLYGFFIPHDLWILLPAILLVRRPDAGRATPLILYGAVLVAAVRLGGASVIDLFGGTELAAWLVLGAVRAVLLAAAWLLLARGLRRLNPAQPAPTAAGLANLVLGCSLLGTGVGLVSSLLHVTTEVDLGTGSADVLSIAGSTAAQVAWAYLLWIVLRGMGDSRRPGIALTMAATGAAVTGVLTGLTMIVGPVVTAAQPSVEFWTGSGLQDLLNALGFIAIALGETLLVAAFALGLGEPPISYARPTTAVSPAAPDATPLPT